jgi:putative protease
VRYDLEMAFSRGLHTGWFEGINNQRLVHAHFGKKRGVFLGRVTRVLREQIAVRLESALRAGDGIVFDAGKPEEKEEGGRVYTLQEKGSDTLLSFGRGDIDFRRVHPGDKVWKTSDPTLEHRLRQTFSGDKPLFRRPVHLEVHGEQGRSLTVLARDELGNIVRVDSAISLSKAEAQPLTTARLREQLGRLGGTPFQLGSLDNKLASDVILPVSELNRLRRQWVAQLEALRAAPKRWSLRPEQGEPGEAPPVSEEHGRERGEPQLNVLVRDLEQLKAVLGVEPAIVYCEFEDPKRYREAVRLFRTWQSALRDVDPQRSERASWQRAAIYVAPPRIFKMGEDWILKQVRSAEADGYLIRNYDHLTYFGDVRRVGDYSLNVANVLAAEYFKSRFGLGWLTASYDLNFDQLEALLSAAPPDWFEVTIHQHMPMFHMEHCVFCAFLSKGTDYTNCGRPCDKHQVQLRDRVGAAHPIKADAGCRNTVFNARAQTGAEYVSRLLRLGLRRFRLEFLDELPEKVALTIRQYRRVLRGEVAGSDVWRELKLMNQLGVTRGAVEREQSGRR